jgi:hypothetical protein
MSSLKSLFAVLLAMLCLAAAARSQDKSESQKIRERLNPENINKSSDQITLERLTALLAPVGVTVNKDNLVNDPKAESHKMMHVTWGAYESAPQLVRPGDPSFHASHTLISVGEKKAIGAATQPRGVDLSGELLFVAAISNGQELIWWTQIDDPRIVRAESADSEGRLSGQLHHASNPTFSINFPDDARIKELRFYMFRSSGTGTTLELINTIPVN